MPFRYDFFSAAQTVIEDNYLQPYPAKSITTADQRGPAKDNLRDGKLERTHHGAMHASRVAGYVVALHALRLKHQDPKALAAFNALAASLNISPAHLLFYTQLAALFHDAARQGEGRDHWDRFSAQRCHDFMISKGISPAIAKLFKAAIVFKSDSKSFYSDANKKELAALGIDVNQADYVRRLIADADTLDVMRVRSEFEINRLSIFRDLKNNAAGRQDVIDLAKQARALIEYQTDLAFPCSIVEVNRGTKIVYSEANKSTATYKPETKLSYEHSSNAYQAVVSDMKDYPLLKPACDTLSKLPQNDERQQFYQQLRAQYVQLELLQGADKWARERFAEHLKMYKQQQNNPMAEQHLQAYQQLKVFLDVHLQIVQHLQQAEQLHQAKQLQQAKQHLQQAKQLLKIYSEAEEQHLKQAFEHLRQAEAEGVHEKAEQHLETYYTQLKQVANHLGAKQQTEKQEDKQQQSPLTITTVPQTQTVTPPPPRNTSSSFFKEGTTNFTAALTKWQPIAEQEGYTIKGNKVSKNNVELLTVEPQKITFKTTNDDAYQAASAIVRHAKMNGIQVSGGTPEERTQLLTELAKSNNPDLYIVVIDEKNNQKELKGYQQIQKHLGIATEADNTKTNGLVK